MNGPEDISGELVHLRQQISLEANIEFAMISIQIVLKFVIGHFVTWFVLAVPLISLLDSVVGQMNKPVGKVAQIELIGARSDVSFFVDVAMHSAAD